MGIKIPMGSFPVIFNKETKNLNISSSKGKTQFSPSKIFGTIIEALSGGIPIITVSSVTERSIRATAEFNEDGSKVTLINTIVTTTTKIRNDEIGSIESITQETTEYTYEHDVIKDSDGNTVLSDQTDLVIILLQPRLVMKKPLKIIRI